MNRIKFDWKHLHVYLCGPMDGMADGGKGWRAEWTRRLVEIGIPNHHVLSPANKPVLHGFDDLSDERSAMMEARKERDWDGLVSIVSKIAHIDLRMVDKSDLVIVNLPAIDSSAFRTCSAELMEAVHRLSARYSGADKHDLETTVSRCIMNMIGMYANQKVPVMGTIHEIVVARQQKKPVMVVCDGGKARCSGWLMWLVGHENVFGGFEELQNRLVAIANGDHPVSLRDWMFLDLGCRD